MDGCKRRDFLLAGAAFGAALAVARAAPGQTRPPRPAEGAGPRLLDLYNVNTKETYRGAYHDGGAILAKAQDELNHFLRDHRENAAARMDPALLDLLWRFQNAVRRAGLGRQVFVTSGYRTQKTNDALRREGAAHNSLHLAGKAVDLVVPGHGVRNYDQIAQRVWSGGLGFYCWSDFIHFDTGPRREWWQPC